MQPGPDSSPLELTLYVQSASKVSMNAIRAARHLCENVLAGRCALHIVDLDQNPQTAEHDAVLATPTLAWGSRRIIGDLSDSARVLELLDLAAL
ncbi:circadian clock KaiB family protein [Hahella aquimaris]|uniref:circadian clock KaiB family protein n=1 Tax=Hahella sp. HNIBRBA332 TaxID=3015983 RepID=UPI00273B305E|nr:circadian clock KaiB family protein [Hahella sp. HNIBRBA332]WLQ13981.1 circadian clock KaiB family protein [Hahella sp. HNIBRBA332]